MEPILNLLYDNTIHVTEIYVEDLGVSRFDVMLHVVRLTLWIPVITIYTPGLTLRNSMFYLQNSSLCLVWISGQAAIFSVYTRSSIFAGVRFPDIRET
jgi:hypothetical protein